MPDVDDLLPVILCELGERIIAMREVLAEPSVATKPHARAVAALLDRGLDALEARLQRDVLTQGGLGGATPAVLDALYQCGQALRALHRRLGLLDMRWSAAPVDIFLRKLRDEVGPDLPHPAVVLSDDYAALDDDVADRLFHDLAASGVEVDAARGKEPMLALPRIESVDPLAWPLLLPALARIHVARRPDGLARAGQDGQVDRPRQRGLSEAARALVADPLGRALVATRLGGPAAFAALAAQMLLFTSPDTPAWMPPFWAVAQATQAEAGGLEVGNPRIVAGGDGAVGILGRLLGARDKAFDRAVASGWGNIGMDERGWAALDLPAPDVPTAAETAALLDKLVAGTPINAIDPPVPADFLQRLEGVGAPDDFYALIGPVGERPASLAAILGVGWLYKVRHSYPLFAELLRERGDVGRALAAYRPHLLERNDLLAQSIEAAHVQGIFTRGLREEAERAAAVRGGLDG